MQKCDALVTVCSLGRHQIAMQRWHAIGMVAFMIQISHLGFKVSLLRSSHHATAE
jgi:hypothetical protein